MIHFGNEALTSQKARGGYLKKSWKGHMCSILPCHKSCYYRKRHKIKPM